MVDKQAMRARVRKEEDYINCPKMSNSVRRLMERYPDGVSDTYIAKVMLSTEEEVVGLYQSAVEKLRAAMSSKKE